MYVIGKNIYNLRKNLNMTQEELARRVGVSEATISNYENNITRPGCTKLSRIADALGVEVKDLFEGTIPKTDFTDLRAEEKELVLEGTDFKFIYNRKMGQSVMVDKGEFDRLNSSTTEMLPKTAVASGIVSENDAIALSGDIPYAYIYIDEDGEAVIFICDSKNAVPFEEFEGGRIITDVDGKTYIIDTDSKKGTQLMCGDYRIGEIIYK